MIVMNTMQQTNAEHQYNAIQIYGKIAIGHSYLRIKPLMHLLNSPIIR